MRPKLYITRSIPQKAVEILLRDFQLSIWDSQECVPRGELINGVRGVHAILCMPTDQIDEIVLDSAGPSLRVVGSLTETCDHIDEGECTKRGVAVIRAPSMTSNQIADMVINLMLLTMKLCAFEDNESVYNNLNNWIVNAFEYKSTRNRTVGILGLGEVGTTIANKLRGLGMNNIIYSDMSESIQGASMDIEFVPFAKLLQRSDIICVCCSLNNSTKDIFNMQTLAKMKESAILINVSSGQLINNSDLYHSLRNGKLAAAGLSVSNTEPMNFKHPLSGLTNCVIQVPKLDCNFNDFRIGLACDVAYKVLSSFPELNGVHDDVFS